MHTYACTHIHIHTQYMCMYVYIYKYDIHIFNIYLLFGTDKSDLYILTLIICIPIHIYNNYRNNKFTLQKIYTSNWSCYRYQIWEIQSFVFTTVTHKKYNESELKWIMSRLTLLIYNIYIKKQVANLITSLTQTHDLSQYYTSIKNCMSTLIIKF